VTFYNVATNDKQDMSDSANELVAKIPDSTELVTAKNYYDGTISENLNNFGSTFPNLIPIKMPLFQDLYGIFSPNYESDIVIDDKNRKHKAKISLGFVIK